MSGLSTLRKHWRIALLIVLVAVSAAVLFAPQFGPDDGGGPVADTGPTNLQFGLELSGGTRVRAPLAGLTAEGVDVDAGQEAQIESEVATELGISGRNVNAYPGETAEDGTVEITTDAVSEEDFLAALRVVEVSGEDTEIRQGVTERTVNEAVEVLDEKIRESPFATGDARKSTSSTGEQFVVVEVPGEDRGTVIDLIEDRGFVEVYAHHPTEEGYTNTTAIQPDDINSIGSPQDEPPYGPHIGITLTEEGAEDFSGVMQETGFTQEGVEACRWDQNRDDPGYCLLTVVDGEVVYSASLGESLAASMESGTYANDPSFVMSGRSIEDVRELRVNLLAGATPAPLDIESGTQYYLEPSLADDFKLYSLVTGLISVVAVSGVVAARYGRPRIAGPMILTAAAEVFLLLGFAAAVGYPLDLAAIAGFIAVVGTGVDDLIIIADEILQEGDVSTSRVFESRFRKAFWVIGAAAATTIVAMSPLAFLSLGDLTGFALFTIVGVLIGVLVTRPAYGDVLRVLLRLDR
ncbi:preprotein translocase subunit SecD [Halalkalicoccus jeotgali]|uniref:Protein-export membrane protein SecD n=1 Tax=Halalkalicoccus jeotgali (strain DSM 18796 / CECT 7217 / JCM 14584 / KCTC 4019 / B3) TaxID=795797 RepID=D8J8Y1_HALJB|nr:preprotein translocase subunit SecD [Halalkalicoccus jeotgali]ADJ14316.1 preprotein translocase subunit SecD [Halalkalicoccus jeotgali B3]ELY40579.1 preprotein translocase subunit SecD [Halalkalicoccus jeotgali B3]